MSGSPTLAVDMDELVALRLQHGLSQEQAAVRAGLTALTVRRIEKGHQDLRVGTLGRLAQLYGVDPDRLLKWRPTDVDT
jgi:transcriptional regulator with XRE-family HTH domain